MNARGMEEWEEATWRNSLGRGSEHLWEDNTEGKQEERERDEVCVTQFCVLMEDSTAISSAAFSQHHHRDGELGKSEKRRDLKSSVQVSVLIACSGRWQRGHIWLIVLFWLPTARWMVLACVHTRACIHFVYILGRCVCVCAHIPAVGVCPCWFVCVSEKSSDFWIFALLQVWESFTDTGQLYEKLYRVRSSDWFVGGVALQIPAACFHCTFVMSRIVCVCLCVHVWVCECLELCTESLRRRLWMGEFHLYGSVCVCVYLCARACVCCSGNMSISISIILTCFSNLLTHVRVIVSHSLHMCLHLSLKQSCHWRAWNNPSRTRTLSRGCAHTHTPPRAHTRARATRRCRFVRPLFPVWRNAVLLIPTVVAQVFPPCSLPPSALHHCIAPFHLISHL